MKLNLKNMLIFTLIFFFTSINNVFAVTEITSRTIIKIDGAEVHKLYDNVAEEGYVDYVGTAVGMLKVTIDGQVYPGYCIDFGMYVSTGTVESPQTLYEYFKNVLSDEAAKDLVKKLTLYTQFGYGTVGKTTDKYYLATQQLIWQAISDTGFYNSDFYHNQTEGTVSKLKIENFRWTNDNGKTTIDISSQINTIKNDINSYYSKPSFCSSTNELELEIGSTAEYIDNNNVLDSYVVTCEGGLKCQTNGNKLSVTAINDAGRQKITFNKAPTGTENYVYRVTGKQGIIIQEGTLEPVSCEFGIDTFKNEKTSDTQIAYVIVIGIFGGIMAYIIYTTKKSLDKL